MRNCNREIISNIVRMTSNKEIMVARKYAVSRPFCDNIFE